MINELAKEINETAMKNGWWKHYIEFRNHSIGLEVLGNKICLMHSELSEALEALRNNSISEHIPNHSHVAEELADTVIRILDYAYMNNFDMEKVIRAKIDYNKTRPYRHGGKKF